MNELQKSLRLNFLFSITSGITMILFYQQIATLFGINNNTVFWIVGVVLIYFALTIWYEIKEQRKLAVIWIIIQDFMWVVGSLILITLNPFEVTLIGNLILSIIGLIVLFMAINQTKELRKIKD